MTKDVIRVLLIDDDEDDCVVTRDLLEEVEGQSFYFKWVPTHHEAVEEIRRGGYHVFLLDVRLGSWSGLDILRYELDHGRKGPVVVLTGHGTRELDVEAMQSGAAGYLVKGTFGAAELERTIRYAIERHRYLPTETGREEGSELARTLVFMGAKGGVGTTTVAANVAAALVRGGREATILDLRSQFGTLASQLDVAPSTSLYDLLELEVEKIDENALDNCLRRHSSGLGVLCSPQRAFNEEQISADCAAAIMKSAGKNKEFVVVDLPSEVTPGSREVLTSADFIGIVVEREPSCVLHAEKNLDMLRAWNVGGTVGLVLVDRTPRSAPLPVSTIRARLNCDVYGTIPAAPDVYQEAQTQGGPLVLLAPQHDAVGALVELAERLSAEKLLPVPV